MPHFTARNQWLSTVNTNTGPEASRATERRVRRRPQPNEGRAHKRTDGRDGRRDVSAAGGKRALKAVPRDYGAPTSNTLGKEGRKEGAALSVPHSPAFIMEAASTC